MKTGTSGLKNSDNSIMEFNLLFVDILLPGINGLKLLEIIKSVNKDIKVIIITSLSHDDIIFKALKMGADGYIYKSDFGNLCKIIDVLLKGGGIITPTIALKIINEFKNSNKNNSSYNGDGNRVKNYDNKIYNNKINNDKIYNDKIYDNKIYDKNNDIYNNTNKINDNAGRQNNYKNINTLTNREREVLELFVEGYTAKEIADILYISVHIVREHIKHIYKKLEINSKFKLIYKYKNFKK